VKGFLRIIPSVIALFLLASCATVPQGGGGEIPPVEEGPAPDSGEASRSLSPLWDNLAAAQVHDTTMNPDPELPFPELPSPKRLLPQVPEPRASLAEESRVPERIYDFIIIPPQPQVSKLEEQKSQPIPKAETQKKAEETVKKPETTQVKKQPEKTEQQKQPERDTKTQAKQVMPSSKVVNNPVLPEKVKERSLITKLFDTLSLSFEGQGWIFVGENAGKTGLAFTSRDTANPSRTGFSFKAREKGDYLLIFQMQDLSVSQLSVERVRVSVLDEKDFFAALSAGRSETGSGQDFNQTQSAGQVQTGDSLFAAKQYPEAYAAYLRNYVPGNPAMENRLAELAMSLGLYAEAVGHWLKLIDSKEGDWARLALRGIFDASLAGRLEDSLISSAERLSSIEGSFSKGDLVATVNALREKKDFRKAVQFCESFIARYPFIKGIDEVYWLLGNLYEEPGALRSEEKAVSYYRIVTDNYPASLFWQRAKDRILFIERNYLFIR
jgi:hypothetical protein